jgi:hypothetical protein
VRTTLDLPDPVFRDLKTKAAREGVTLKDLVTSFVKEGLYGKQEATPKPVRSPLPEPLPSRGGPPLSLTNAEIEELLLQEDLERCGYKPRTNPVPEKAEP